MSTGLLVLRMLVVYSIFACVVKVLLHCLAGYACISLPVLGITMIIMVSVYYFELMRRL